eukprot:370645-Amphidinium_carterae.2
MSTVELQDTMLNGCLNSFAYMAQKSLAQLREQPWCLCHGDVKQNVSDLLGSLGLMSESKLQEAVFTLMNSSFSAFHVEKMHASVALVRKYHPDVTTGSQARTLQSHCKQNKLISVELLTLSVQFQSCSVRSPDMLPHAQSSINDSNLNCLASLASSSRDFLPHASSPRLHSNHGSKALS